MKIIGGFLPLPGLCVCVCARARARECVRACARVFNRLQSKPLHYLKVTDCESLPSSVPDPRTQLCSTSCKMCRGRVWHVDPS